MKVCTTLALFVCLLCAGQDKTRPPKPRVAPVPPPVTLNQARSGFVNPPADYRSMPLWVWNDEMSAPRIDEMLKQYREQGMGGAFVHPRPGLITEYLSPEWFQSWRRSLETGKALGLRINIYDENSYPSGFAGGHVPSQVPDTASQYVVAETDLTASAVTSNPLVVACFAGPKGSTEGMRRVFTRAEVRDGETVTLFRLRRASGNPWTGEFPYVDLTNPRTTPAFLQVTHEAYKKQFGAEFGRSIRWAFADEPLLATGGAYDTAKLALPLSFYTLSEFRKRNGYDLADQIASLYWDTGDFRKVRFDYWQTLHDLWKENYMRPMFEWCDANGLQFTGHWMEHEWPNPWITPDDASLYAYEHMPGIDMLEGTNLRLKGKDEHMLFTIRQVASVSHQLGRRVFCEAYGVAGWDSTFEHYKRFGDWLMVNGVNFMDQHLSFSTVRGARKRDHPQSFSDVSPWWPYYRLHADHLARVSYLSSLSEPRPRVLMLQQTTSGFLLARRGAATPELAAMRAANAALTQFLVDHQVDYDLGDEYMLEWYGGVANGKFTVAKAAYDLLVLPPDLTTLRHQSVPLLEAWLKSGGNIISLSAPPAFIDGRPSDAMQRLRDQYAPQWQTVDSHDALLSGIRKRLAPRIEIDAPVGFSERYLASGERVLFFTNTGLTRIKTEARVDGAALEEWDTVSGKINLAAYATAGGKLTFTVDLEPAASALYVVRNTAATPRAVTQLAWSDAPKASWSAKTDSTDNVLVLDYCDLTIGKEQFPDINTWKANWNIWQRHGFERPAWDNAVQFKRTVLDRNHFGPGSGFTARFHFTVNGAVPKDLRLAVELPELYRIKLNGKPVDFKAGRRWLDPHILAAPVAALAQTGENEVTIEGAPFDVHMELENIYLLGSFGVETAERGFRIAAQHELELGSWASQGRPFFAGTALYSTTVNVPAGAKRLKVELGKWNGSLAEVLIDGKRAGLLGWPPYELEIGMTPGAHKLELRVVSTPRNVFGPYHLPSKPRMRAWPAAWSEFPDHQPAGSAYDVLDYGLMDAPKLSFGR